MSFPALVAACFFCGAAAVASAQHVELQQVLADASRDGSNLTALVSDYYNAQMTALSQLRSVVEQLPQRLESALSDKLSQQLSKQVRTMIVDPTQVRCTQFWERLDDMLTLPNRAAPFTITMLCPMCPHLPMLTGCSTAKHAFGHIKPLCQPHGAL